MAQDNSNGIETVLHALENLSDVENILLMQPTSPLRKTNHINEIFKLRSKFNSDSAVSLTPSKKHLDLFFSMDSRKKIISSSENLRLAPRQDYPCKFILNGSLYLANKESIQSNRSFITSNTIGYIMPEEYSIDIDTQLDWDIAEFLMTKMV